MADAELEQRAAKRIGSVLCGKYRIDSVLGAGGMAVVFAATHRNQKRVAIKMLHPELSINTQLKTRFLREGYAANTVDHAGAVAVLDDDTGEDGSAFLVMERLEGEEVDRLWEKWERHLPEDVVLAIAGQLLDVLAAAHAKSIIHRDIKPSNLYVTTDGTLKVLDFGIARVRDVASTGPSATSTGMMLGTPAFMAPEQALGKSNEMDGTTDLWSVGATMFALLSGRFVHEGESVTQIVIQVATQPARSLSAVVPNADRRIVEIVDKALAFNKSDRWPSALAMRDAVRATYSAIYGAKLNKEPLERFLAEPGPPAQRMGAPRRVALVAASSLPGQAGPVELGHVGPSHEPVPRVPPTQEMEAYPPRAPSGFLPDPRAAPGRAMPTAPLPRVSQPPGGAWGLPHVAATAQPVSTEYRPPGLEAKRLNTMVLLVALVLGGLIAGAGVVMWMLGSRAPNESSIQAAPSLATGTVPPAPPPPSILVASPPAPSAPPPPPSVSVVVTPPPPVAPPPKVPVYTPFIPPTPSKPDCRIPYTVDSRGIRHPKPECE
jgi:eukaryotic-like serine/threonine-protein kinase